MDSSWSRTHRSPINSFGIWHVHKKISLFRVLELCQMTVFSLHMHPVCILYPFFKLVNIQWAVLLQFWANLHVFCIVELISSSTDRLWVDVCGNIFFDKFALPTPVYRIPFLGLYSLLPVVKSLCFHRRSVSVEWLLGWIISGYCHAPGSESSLFGAFVWPDIDNSSLFSGVIARIIYAPFHISSIRKRN